MQTQRYINIQEYGAVVSNAYIIPQVSGTHIKLFTAAIMVGYHNLSEFERGVIVSEVAMRW